MTHPIGWWPTDPAALTRMQRTLAAAEPPPWRPTGTDEVGASACCFAGPATLGEPEDPTTRGWAAAYRPTPDGPEIAVSSDRVTVPYVPGELALREGPLRAAALDRLTRLPDLVMVTAAGRDHPAQAGLATLLGAAVDVPTIGITDRPLAGRADQPAKTAGARTPLVVDGEIVGWWLCTQTAARPIAVSAGWRTSAEVALVVTLASIRAARMPEPVRHARRAAREARARVHASRTDR